MEIISYEDGIEDIPVRLTGCTANCSFELELIDMDLQTFGKAGGFNFVPRNWNSASAYRTDLPIGSLRVEYRKHNDVTECIEFDQNCLREFWTRTRAHFGKRHWKLMQDANNLLDAAELAAIKKGLDFDTEVGSKFIDEWLSANQYDQITCEMQSLWTISVVVSNMIECEISHGRMNNLAMFLTKWMQDHNRNGSVNARKLLPEFA